MEAKVIVIDQSTSNDPPFGTSTSTKISLEQKDVFTRQERSVKN